MQVTTLTADNSDKYVKFDATNGDKGRNATAKDNGSQIEWDLSDIDLEKQSTVLDMHNADPGTVIETFQKLTREGIQVVTVQSSYDTFLSKLSEEQKIQWENIKSGLKKVLPDIKFDEGPVLANSLANQIINREEIFENVKDNLKKLNGIPLLTLSICLEGERLGFATIVFGLVEQNPRLKKDIIACLEEEIKKMKI